MTTITVLTENTAPESSPLVAEHGLSFFVETARTKFIFDCGHTGAAFANAKILGVDLRGVKFVALSHSHYDHAGGFPKLLDFAPIETIITGENFWQEKFSRTEDGFKYRGCGFDEKFLAARGIEQKICRDVIALDSDAWLVGDFKRRYDFETIPEKFVKGSEKVPDNFSDGNVTLHPDVAPQLVDDSKVVAALESRFTPDNFSDEIVLILREVGGLAIVTACAHSGILNIVADVSERFNLPIVSVIGGLHLTGATQERIFRTLAELKALGVQKVLPCHCSGEDFMRNFPRRLSTGSVIEIT